MWNIDQHSLVSWAGYVVIAIHRVHTLETHRAGPISRQILVLSEHNLFTLKGKGT